MNEQKFEHLSRFGTTFKADRCDFRGGVAVIKPKGISTENLMSDVSEMIGYHAHHIHPRLNEFSGYDCITYILFDLKNDFSGESVKKSNENRKYRLGNQPEEYELREDYLSWIPEGYEDWGELIFLNVKNQEIKIKNEDISKTIFLHHYIVKDAFPLEFFGEERAENLHLFAIVSETENSEKFVIPLH